MFFLDAGGMLHRLVVTLLTTPKSGAEMRDQLKDLVDRGADKVRSKYHEVEGKVEGKLGEAFPRK